MFRLIVQSNFRYFHGEKSHVDQQVVNVKVTNVRVKFTYTGGATPSDRLANYASDISIWADGQKIGNLSPSDFVRDSEQ